MDPGTHTAGFKEGAVRGPKSHLPAQSWSSYIRSGTKTHLRGTMSCYGLHAVLGSLVSLDQGSSQHQKSDR